jgi:hypothetical protein
MEGRQPKPTTQSPISIKESMFLLGHLDPEGKCGARTHHRTVQFSKSLSRLLIA